MHFLTLAGFHSVESDVVSMLQKSGNAVPFFWVINFDSDGSELWYSTLVVPPGWCFRASSWRFCVKAGEKNHSDLMSALVSEGLNQMVSPSVVHLLV